MNCRGIAVMEKSLEVTDNSSKLEDENASSYSAQFQLDNLQPSKKGQRESVSLHVKVNTVSDHLYPCHEPTVDISSVLLISSRGTDSAFRGMCTVRPVMDFLERAWLYSLSTAHAIYRFVCLSSWTAVTSSLRPCRSKSIKQTVPNIATGARLFTPSSTNVTLTSKTTALKSSKILSDKVHSKRKLDKQQDVFDRPE